MSGGNNVGGKGVGGSNVGGNNVGGNNVGGNGVGGNNVGGNNVGGNNVGGNNVGGAAGVGAGGVGVGGAPPVTKPPCITSGATQAAIIGDSYVTGAGTPALQPALVAIDPTMSSYKNYAVAGTSMASGGILGFIPPQLTSALAQPIKLLIMDGGGNDILICDAGKYPGCGTTCKSPGSSTAKICTDIVQAATDAATALMQKASDAGVRDVIYFFYPHLPGANAGYTEILDYSEPLAKAKCDGAAARTNGKLTCHFVDTAKPFDANGGTVNIAADSIHPAQSGQNIIAKEITNVMKAACLGQPASSGCCTP